MSIKFEHNEKPPIYEKCVEAFGVDWDKGVIFTYGNTIYSKFQIDPIKVSHEMIHVRQQSEIGKEIWWEKYLSDPKFRLDQEIEAYLEENKMIDKIKDRNLRFRIKQANARDLSRGYGDIISFYEAFKILNK